MSVLVRVPTEAEHPLLHKLLQTRQQNCLCAFVQLRRPPRKIRVGSKLELGDNALQRRQNPVQLLLLHGARLQTDEGSLRGFALGNHLCHFALERQGAVIEFAREELEVFKLPFPHKLVEKLRLPLKVALDLAQQLLVIRHQFRVQSELQVGVHLALVPGDQGLQALLHAGRGMEVQADGL